MRGRRQWQAGAGALMAVAVAFLVVNDGIGGALGKQRAVSVRPCSVLPEVHVPPPGCKKLLWFMGLSEDRDPKTHEVFWNQMVVTMLSAREKAPSLQPVLIWLSPPNNHSRWFERLGGIVIHHSLTFLDRMKAAVEAGHRPKEWIKYAGAYARLDAPLLAQRLRPIFDPEVFELDYVFYTDVDVVFYKDINSCSIPPPRYLSYGAEAFRNQLSQNTGVMYMNVSAMLESVDGLLSKADELKWDTPAFDQGLVNLFFEGKVNFLPDEFNWKVYWGKNDNISILHFHGPKPAETCYQCYVGGNHEPEKDPACSCTNPSFPFLFSEADKADGAELMKEADRLYRMYLGPRYHHLTGLGSSRTAVIRSGSAAGEETWHHRRGAAL